MNVYPLQLFAVLSLALFVSQLPAQEPKKENPLEAYEKAGRVGPMHKKLEGMVGEWTFSGKMWMTPGQKPTELNGKAQRTLLLGGRFVREVMTSSSLGKEIKGISWVGYDNHRKEYVSTWIDSTSTSITTMSGKVDRTGKVWTFRGQQVDPVSKVKIQMRDVISVINRDKHVMKAYRKAPGGEEFKLMELVFTRTK